MAVPCAREVGQLGHLGTWTVTVREDVTGRDPRLMSPSVSTLCDRRGKQDPQRSVTDTERNQRRITMIEALIIIGLVVFVGKVLHIGHKGAKRRGQRGIGVYWNSARGRPYVSIPLPFGLRLGRRL